MWTRRLLVLAIGVGLAACHGIEHPQSPISPTPRSTAPARLTIVQTPGEIPVGGGSALLIIEALGADGLGVVTPVSLEASGGELGTDRVTTDTTGHATASWQGTTSATLTARAGEMVTVAPLRVQPPVVLPPPSVPPPPAPRPAPDPPAPPPAPSLTLTATASPFQVAVGAPVILSITTANLAAGESITAYQWDWEGTGKGTTFDDTSVDASRAHTYATDGIKAPIVKVLTSSGRTTSTTGRIVVYKP